VKDVIHSHPTNKHSPVKISRGKLFDNKFHNPVNKSTKTSFKAPIGQNKKRPPKEEDPKKTYFSLAQARKVKNSHQSGLTSGISSNESSVDRLRMNYQHYFKDTAPKPLCSPQATFSHTDKGFFSKPQRHHTQNSREAIRITHPSAIDSNRTMPRTSKSRTGSRPKIKSKLKDEMVMIKHKIDSIKSATNLQFDIQVSTSKDNSSKKLAVVDRSIKQSPVKTSGSVLRPTFSFGALNIEEKRPYGKNGAKMIAVAKK
jgi:hypothetical protein